MFVIVAPGNFSVVIAPGNFVVVVSPANLRTTSCNCDDNISCCNNDPHQKCLAGDNSPAFINKTLKNALNVANISPEDLAKVIFVKILIIRSLLDSFSFETVYIVVFQTKSTSVCNEMTKTS